MVLPLRVTCSTICSSGAAAGAGSTTATGSGATATGASANISEVSPLAGAASRAPSNMVAISAGSLPTSAPIAECSVCRCSSVMTAITDARCRAPPCLLMKVSSLVRLTAGAGASSPNNDDCAPGFGLTATRMIRMCGLTIVPSLRTDAATWTGVSNSASCDFVRRI